MDQGDVERQIFWHALPVMLCAPSDHKHQDRGHHSGRRWWWGGRSSASDMQMSVQMPVHQQNNSLYLSWSVQAKGREQLVASDREGRLQA
eukprot:960774-Pelagomonas_calceolata.AAC.2